MAACLVSFKKRKNSFYLDTFSKTKFNNEIKK